MEEDEEELLSIDMDMYYTPEAEEFCLGFPYWEYMEPHDRPPYWVSQVYEGDLPKGSIEWLVENKKVRVQVLNRGNLELLGWLFNEEDSDETAFCFELWEYELVIEPNNTAIWRNSDIVYSGDIKNKWEMRRLMKRIGIENKEVRNGRS